MRLNLGRQVGREHRLLSHAYRVGGKDCPPSLGKGQRWYVPHFVLNLSILGRRILSGAKVRPGGAPSDVNQVGGARF